MNAPAAEGFVLGGPLGDGEEVLLVIDAASAEALRARLARDPWTQIGLLEIARVEPDHPARRSLVNGARLASRDGHSAGR